MNFITTKKVQELEAGLLNMLANLDWKPTLIVGIGREVPTHIAEALGLPLIEWDIKSFVDQKDKFVSDLIEICKHHEGKVLVVETQNKTWSNLGKVMSLLPGRSFSLLESMGMTYRSDFVGQTVQRQDEDWLLPWEGE